jgi:hypothetical protein
MQRKGADAPAAFLPEAVTIGKSDSLPSPAGCPAPLRGRLAGSFSRLGVVQVGGAPGGAMGGLTRAGVGLRRNLATIAAALADMVPVRTFVASSVWRARSKRASH